MCSDKKFLIFLLSAMRKTSFKKNLTIAIVILFLIPATGFFGFYSYRTFATTGEKAIAVMTPEELTVLEKVSQIDKNMNAEEVFRILGEPTEDLLVIAKWNGMGGSSLSQGRVYFRVRDGKVREFRLIKLGYFFYVINF